MFFCSYYVAVHNYFFLTLVAKVVQQYIYGVVGHAV